MHPKFVISCLGIIFPLIGNVYAQKPGVLVNLRTGLLNYDIGAEITLHTKHTIYPYFGFGHTMVYTNDRYFYGERPEHNSWLNFGHMSWHAGLEYRYYPNSVRITAQGKLNKGLFIGIKGKYSFGDPTPKNKSQYSFDASLKIAPA